MVERNALANVAHNAIDIGSDCPISERATYGHGQGHAKRSSAELIPTEVDASKVASRRLLSTYGRRHAINTANNRNQRLANSQTTYCQNRDSENASGTSTRCVGHAGIVQPKRNGTRRERLAQERQPHERALLAHIDRASPREYRLGRPVHRGRFHETKRAMAATNR